MYIKDIKGIYIYRVWNSYSVDYCPGISNTILGNTYDVEFDRWELL